jgi:uncharacterized protein
LNLTIIATVGLYAVLNSAILWWITIKTGSLRSLYKVSIGDGGNERLTRILRGHANAMENMPMFFVLLTIAALMNAPLIAIHVLGVSFTVGRFLHALHFTADSAPGWQRQAGFTLSFLAWVLVALGVAGHAIKLMLA